MTHRDDSWPFGEFFTAGFGPRAWSFDFGGCGPQGRRRGRRQMFEAGEMKYVILRLLREKPRHGYEVIRALEEKLGGWYTPSAGTVYPTLQLLEDQGYVRIVEEGGKKVYHITPEGERFLDEHKSTLEDIMERVGDAVRGMAGGAMGELNTAFARIVKGAWRAAPDSDRTRKVAEILRRAADEIEALGKTPG
jgi:DNA-binding PadR family transcriptional regulator